MSIPRVLVKDDDDDILVRDCMLSAFFCTQPYSKLAKAAGKIFEDWMKRTPPDAKKWACIGPNADEDKPFDPKKHLTRAMAEFDPVKAKSRDLCSLEIGGPQQVNPDDRFAILGECKPEDTDASMLEIRSPSASAVDAASADAYVKTVAAIAEQLPYDSGYASPALTYGADSQMPYFAQAARKWAFRHPGFDMSSNNATNTGIGRLARGAYWLTFLGPWAAKELGGEAGLRKKLPKDIEVQTVGGGVMLRAGKLPDVGDVNKSQKLPLLRAMAKVIEPVTRFNDTFLNAIFTDVDEIYRWERRHLD